MEKRQPQSQRAKKLQRQKRTTSHDKNHNRKSDVKTKQHSANGRGLSEN